MPKDKRSFFERLTGSVDSGYDDNDEEALGEENENSQEPGEAITAAKTKNDWLQNSEEGQLTVDVYQTPNEIVIQSTVAGVKPEDLDVTITQEMGTIRGKRQRQQELTKDNYYYQELYWGSFSRSILLPQEVDTEEAEATLKNGLLIIRLPKMDKNKVQKLKVKLD